MDLKNIVRNLTLRTPLTHKVMLLTALIGLTLWLITDCILTKKLKEISDADLSQRLYDQFQEDRIRFDKYLEAFQHVLPLIISQKNFYDYVGKLSRPGSDASGPRYYSEVPPWLPDAAVLRHLAHIRFAFLMDQKGRVREVYSVLSGAPPDSLVQPSDRILRMSRNQSFMTYIDGMPFVLTSGQVHNAKGANIATLMLAACLDDDFLIASEGLTSTRGIVGLIGGDKPRIVASNRPDILPAGTSLDDAKKKYHLIGKAFFDIGSSELTVQFTSFISKSEFERRNADILHKEQMLRAFLSFAFIFSFAIAMIWITKRIQGLTLTVRELSQDMLKIQPPGIQKGDEIIILGDYFRFIVEKIVRDLEQRNAELEYAVGELDAFSYSVSHDLRAPLRAIAGFSQILLESEAKLNENEKQYLGMILKSTEKMRQLIDDLLSFSRMGRQEMTSTGIDTETLATGVFKELKAASPDRKVNFILKPLPYIHGDRAMVRQVFVNLLSNALKFTREKEETTIEVGSRSEGDNVVYYVKDNGAGFDASQADRLFKVFQRLHTEAEFEGTGVGLALVQRIIHRHGGRVWAEGKVGEGATFYFALPIK